MNKYENNNNFSKENRTAKIESDKLFTLFREIVLNNKDYALGKAQEIIDSLNIASARRLFETFNEQEGALPDNLAQEYIKLVYGPENIQAKMVKGQTFHEALAALAWEIKNLQINLNPELVNSQIKLSERLIQSELEAQQALVD